MLKLPRALVKREANEEQGDGRKKGKKEDDIFKFWRILPSSEERAERAQSLQLPVVQQQAPTLRTNAGSHLREHQRGPRACYY